jgi:hypothetical protein
MFDCITETRTYVGETSTAVEDGYAVRIWRAIAELRVGS